MDPKYRSIFHRGVSMGLEISYKDFLGGDAGFLEPIHTLSDIALSFPVFTYDGDSISPEISLPDLKIHLNSIISNVHREARYMTADITNYYLNNPMSNFQYMRIHLRDIPH